MKMKIAIISLLLIFSCFMVSCEFPFPIGPGPEPTPEVSANEKTINVYLIAGQSNAVGYGMDLGNRVSASDSRFTEGFENVLYYGVQERWNGKNLDNGFKPLTLGMGVASDRSGAEIGIANMVANNGEMNAIIKCAWGATHLYPDTKYEVSIKQGTWTSPTYIKNNNINTSENPMIGNMYNRFEDTVTEALQLLVEDGYTPVIKGVWWMQGEAEMFTLEMASAYRELFEALIFDTRNMLSEATGYDCSKVPFVCGLPKWNTKNSAPPMYQGMVRTAMSTVAQELENVACIDCMPLNQHDDWHFDAEGQLYLGESFISRLESIEEENSSGFDENISINNDIKLLIDECGMEFRADLTNYNSKNGYEYGFIVVPTADLNQNSINSDYIEKLNRFYIEHANVPAEVVVEKVDDVHSDIYLTAKISDVLYEDLNTSYTAIAYIKDSYGNYLYSSRYVADSVARLASEELYKDTENRDAIQKIVNAGINFLNEVPFDERENDNSLELIVEEEINIGLSESKLGYPLNVEKSVRVDYFVKYTSNDTNVVTVDENGVLVAKGEGSTTVTVECAGKSKTVNVSVGFLSNDGIVLDGEIGENEYVGELISAKNDNVSAEFAGMIKDGKLYLSFTLVHGEWSPLNNSWWLNDNIEFKLNNGASYTVVFYEGEPTYSSNITSGMSKTVEVDGKLVTVVELCIENVPGACQLKVGMNGTNFGWLGAIWNDNVCYAYVTEEGIIIGKPVNMGNGIILDGSFDESVYTESVKNNVINANGNGADINMIGTLTDGGILFGITIDHTKPVNTSTNGSGNWFTFMNVEFRISGNDTQFMFFAQNQAFNGNMFSYCKTVERDGGYTSTLEIFIPYEALGVSNGVESIDFTARGWFESGWCDLLNNSWDATHKVTADGLTVIK